MNKLHAFLAIFLLSALCGCRSKKEEETEIENRYIQLLHALVTDDTPALRREQHYITDTLPPDTLLAFPHRDDYMRVWADSYILYDAVMKAEKPEVATTLASERFCTDMKRLAARLIGAGRRRCAEDMLRPVAECLSEHGMNDAAAVTAAACMGIDADPAHPGDIARRLLTRLLLVGKRAPCLSYTAPSVSAGPTLLLFYETDCPGCESVLRDLCGFYATLKGIGIHVVSIASDEDEHTFSSRAASLPWATKLHDSRGFRSPDFEAYGVAFIPTLVLVHLDGRVAGSYSTLEETGLIRSLPALSPLPASGCGESRPIS
ncbi:peroxiredoxin family protein [Bacteroides pyogenes]|uniref:peroxiredoxin family protein n=1 Tax=Bacteroides pyogenes TaxID=310300 RepID=UPI003F9F6E13